MSTQTKAKGPGYQMFWDREDEMLSRLTDDFKAGQPLDWPVLSPDLVHRVWSDFSRDGYVRDERALDNIFASIRDNVLRLQIATIAAAHTEADPEEYLQEYLEPGDCEAFTSWLVATQSGERISDCGLGPLIETVALAFEARTAGERLKYLDRALHITHFHGDLAKLFIEGGRKNVPEIES